MKLLATKPLRHGGQDYQPGDEFEASDRDGKLLKAIRKAQDAPDEVPTAAQATDAVRKPKKSTAARPSNSGAPNRKTPDLGTGYRTRRLKAKD